jgi:hypothetical protein
LQLLLIFEGNILSQSFLIKVFADQQKSKKNCQIDRCQKHPHRFILATACDSTNDSSGDSELHCQNDKVAQILVDSSQPQHFNGGPLKPHVSFQNQCVDTSQTQEHTQDHKECAQSIVPARKDETPPEPLYDDQGSCQCENQRQHTHYRVDCIPPLPVVLQVSTSVHL